MTEFIVHVENRPGRLAAITEILGDAGVNIECVYSDHDHRLIVCVDDLDAAHRVAASWR